MRIRSPSSVCGPATGHVIGGNGKGNFSGHRNIGDTGDCMFGPGLQNNQQEVHVVVRTHGEAIPGLVNEQISTLNGGCNPGEPNEGVCANVQGAAFPVP